MAKIEQKLKMQNDWDQATKNPTVILISEQIRAKKKQQQQQKKKSFFIPSHRLALDRH